MTPLLSARKCVTVTTVTRTLSLLPMLMQPTQSVLFAPRLEMIWARVLVTSMPAALMVTETLKPLVAVQMTSVSPRHLLTGNQEDIIFSKWSAVVVPQTRKADAMGSTVPVSTSRIVNTSVKVTAVTMTTLNLTNYNQLEMLKNATLVLRLGWFTAYLANVFLTKLQGPISPSKSRDSINPKHASES